MIAGVLLASGASRRFGADKLVAPLGARPLARWSAEALARAVDATYVVVRDQGGAIHDALRDLGVRWIENPFADTGMASAIRAGVGALPEDAEAVVIALADQPLVDPLVVHALVARWRRGGAAAVVPRYDDGRGHPVLFGASLFPALLALEGDRGARAVLEALRDSLAEIEVAGARPADVDTPRALAALERSLARRAHELE